MLMKKIYGVSAATALGKTAVHTQYRLHPPPSGGPLLNPEPIVSNTEGMFC